MEEESEGGGASVDNGAKCADSGLAGAGGDVLDDVFQPRARLTRTPNKNERDESRGPNDGVNQFGQSADWPDSNYNSMGSGNNTLLFIDENVSENDDVEEVSNRTNCVVESQLGMNKAQSGVGVPNALTMFMGRAVRTRTFLPLRSLKTVRSARESQRFLLKSNQETAKR